MKQNKSTPTRLEKRIKKIKYRDKMKIVPIALVLALILVLENSVLFVGVVAQTRDPRFYSRVGDKDYQWPNPGDPNYRYKLFKFFLKIHFK